MVSRASEMLNFGHKIEPPDTPTRPIASAKINMTPLGWLGNNGALTAEEKNVQEQ
jgi:hypothetical protein